jgi:DNA-binding NtrC family response regulator
MDHQTPSTPSTADRQNRVLLVDDDPEILKVAGIALTRHDFSCTKVASGAQALSVLRGPNPFDLMLIDVIMPGISGLEVARRALELSPDLGVITMSGIGEMHTPVDALRAGSIDYLIKPFDVAELIECVDRSVKRRHEAFERKRAQNQVGRWDAAARALALSLNVKDKETEGHAERVFEFSKRLGRLCLRRC